MFSNFELPIEFTEFIKNENNNCKFSQYPHRYVKNITIQFAINISIYSTSKLKSVLWNFTSSESSKENNSLAKQKIYIDRFHNYSLNEDPQQKLREREKKTNKS